MSQISSYASLWGIRLIIAPPSPPPTASIFREWKEEDNVLFITRSPTPPPALPPSLSAFLLLWRQ